MVYGIPAYKLQKDVVAAEIDVLREMGVEIRCGVEVGKDISLNDLRQDGFKAFYGHWLPGRSQSRYCRRRRCRRKYCR